MQELKDTLQTAWGNLGLSNFDNVWTVFIDAYSEDHRHYHTLAHIEDMVDKRLLNFNHLIEDHDCYTVAEFFHDSIFEITSRTNEEDTAHFVDELMLRNSGGDNQDKRLARNKVFHLIAATKHNKILAKTNDQKILADIDMSILGSTIETFLDYEEKIIKEFMPTVGEDLFYKHRKAFLENLKDQDIFYTETAQILFADNAQKNINILLNSEPYISIEAYKPA